jgi:hypothetical protein
LARIAVLVLACAALARAEDQPAPPPALGLEVPDRVFDAGKLDRGTVLKHVFTLKNVGSTELAIDAKPG